MSGSLVKANQRHYAREEVQVLLAEDNREGL